MGRWTFQGGSPLYVPDPGEEGGGSTLGHLAAGVGETMGGIFGGLQSAGDALAATAVGKALAGPVGAVSDSYQENVMPQFREAGKDLAIPARGVVAASTAATDALTGSNFMGDSDPFQYTIEGKGNLAHMGDLMADVMEAEGTINEQGMASQAVRAAGNTISDPLVLFGAARGAAKMLSRIPRPKAAPAASSGGGGTPTRYRTPPIDRPSGPSQWPSVPLDPDLASPAILGRGGVGSLPKAPGTVYRGGALDADLAAPGAPAGPGRMPTARRGVPPAAARPLDPDLAYGSGPQRGLPKTKAAKANARKLKGATKKMKAEQLEEGRSAMKAEQLGEGRAAMVEEQVADGVSRGQYERGYAPPWNESPLEFRARMEPNITPASIASTPIAPPMSRAQMRMLIQAAVENGASADDVMKLLSNLGG